MSIQAVPIDIYGHIYTKAMAIKSDINKGQIFISSLNELNTTQVKEWLETLLVMNRECYSSRYNHPMEPIPEIKYKEGKTDISLIQFLKWLHCIDDNIVTDYLEELSEEDLMCIEITKYMIQQIQYEIISALPEYQQSHDLNY